MLSIEKNSVSATITNYFAYLIIMLCLFRISWFPGSGVFLAFYNEIVVVFYVSFFVFTFSFPKFFTYRLQIRSFLSFLFLLSFILLIVNILIFNIQEVTTVQYLLKMFVLLSNFIFFFFLIPNLFSRKVHFFLIFVKFIFWLSTIASIFGLLLFLSGAAPVEGRYSGYTVSFSVHPNYISGFYLIGIFTSVYYFLTNKGNWKIEVKALVSAATFLQVMALLFTFSRGAILGLVIGAIVFMALYFRHKFLVIFPVIVLIIASYLINFFVAKGFASFISRFALLIPAYYMVSENVSRLLFGFGYSDTFEVYSKYRLLYLVFEPVNNPHNSYVSLLLMVGLILFLLIMIIISILMLKTIRAYLKTNDSKEKLLFLFLISIVTAILIHSFFESQLVMTDFYNMAFFFIYTGIMYVCVQFNKAKSFVF